MIESIAAQFLLCNDFFCAKAELRSTAVGNSCIYLGYFDLAGKAKPPWKDTGIDTSRVHNHRFIILLPAIPFEFECVVLSISCLHNKRTLLTPRSVGALGVRDHRASLPNF